MSYYVWHWAFDRSSHNQFTLPYAAQSPITKINKYYSSEDDIWNEIEQIEKSNNKYSIGQQLFYLLPIFANPNYIINNEHIQLLNEYHYITEYNIPLAQNLDEANAYKLSMFNIIKNEMSLALNHKANKKDGNSKS